jgi:hypothetical protein
MEDSGTKKNNANQRVAIIGTGPASLLKALQLAKSNPLSQVTLFDSASTPGGAWYSDKSPKGYEIECGCHIWSYVPKAYRFIEQEMGVKLYPVKPSPLFIGTRVRLPYSVKNTIDSYRILLKFLFTLRWNKLGNLQRDPNINFRIFGKRNRYPKSGSPELIHSLLAKIAGHSNITIRLNTGINACHIQDSVVSLQVKNELHVFDKLYLTYVSRIDRLTIQGTEHKVNVRAVNYIHFLIQTNKPLLKKMTYWRLINDHVIHRITDISGQTNLEENLVLIGIKDGAFHTSDEKTLLEHCRAFFKNYGLIDDTFQFEKIKTHLFPTHYLSDETIAALKKQEPMVSIMRTTDLMHGIYFLLEDREVLL